ncbi:MAG: xylulokinase, partial [Gammaproteobacteria bacterium RIFCSPHIGHO2_12_FULL_38_11]
SPLTVSRPKPLWSEQNPLDWWNALNAAMQQLHAKFPNELKKVKVIGLAGQQHGAVLLDDKNNVLRPAILWNDGRSSEECLALMNSVPHAMKIAGSIIMPGFTAPKALWVRKHEFDIFKKINKILLPKDYLRFLMTHDFATDMSDASGTGWLDIEKRQWSPELLAACDLSVKNMPQLFEGNAITGKIKNSISQYWGLSENVKIVAGAGDNAASAISMGSVNPHTAYLSLGTSATFFIACEKYQPNPTAAIHTFCHAVPNYWHHMAVHLNGASTITWITHLFNEDIPTLLSGPRNADLIFLPYLSGERTPHNNPHASGVFFGLNNLTTKADMTMAVLEGTAFGITLGYEALLQDPNLQIDEISVVGGGSRHDAWGIMFASALKRPLTYRKVREVGAAFGAAKLAWMSDFPSRIIAEPEVEKVLQPNEDLMLQYEKKYREFKKLYHDVFKN